MAMTLPQLRRYALSLPGTSEQPHFERTSFRAGGRIFMTAKPEEPYINVFVGEELREPALAAHPDWVAKLPWGGKIVGLRILLTGASPAVVKDLVKAAWQLRAPRKTANAARSPQQPPAGYSGTPLAKKLGIGAGSNVCVIDAPIDYSALIAPLPTGVVFGDRAAAGVDVAHLFVTRRTALARQLTTLRRKLRADAALWISWPKKASKQPSDITEDVIRELALPLGFVDIKVCAVDATWSALKLVVRKELR